MFLENLFLRFCRDPSFNYQYNFILNYYFFDQKSGKFGRNSKILSPITYFPSGFIYSYIDLMDLENFSIFGLSVGVSSEKIVTLLEKN